MASKEMAEKANGGTVSMNDLTDDVMRAIGTTGDAFADAMNIAEQIYGTVPEIAEEIGNGFALLDDKNKLVGTPLVLLKWAFSNGDFGVFCSAAVVTKDGGKYIVNDGSTGLCTQLREYSVNTNRYGGVVAKRGFRESTYSTCKGCGKPRSSMDDTCTATLKNGSVCGDSDTSRGTGQTFYLDTAASD